MAELDGVERRASEPARLMRLGRRSVLGLIGAGALLAGLAHPALAEAPAGPPLYVVEQGGAKVYILGVAGGLSIDSWYTPTIRAALLSSQEFWSETPPPPTSAPPPDDSFRRIAFRDSGSLFDGMSQSDADRLIKAAAPLGVTREQLARMRPWFAAVQLSVTLQSKEEGAAGTVKLPEYHLRSVAEQAHIPVRSEMASVEDYVRFMSDLPEGAQYEYLSYMLEMAELDPATMRGMDEEWAKGNLRPYEELMTGQQRRYPEAMGKVNAGRNVAWGERIKGMLAEGGVRFVCIGLGHMFGPDSIPAQLQRLGLKLHRVDGPAA